MKINFTKSIGELIPNIKIIPEDRITIIIDENGILIEEYEKEYSSSIVSLIIEFDISENIKQQIKISNLSNLQLSPIIGFIDRYVLEYMGYNFTLTPDNQYTFTKLDDFENIQLYKQFVLKSLVSDFADLESNPIIMTRIQEYLSSIFEVVQVKQLIYQDIQISFIICKYILNETSYYGFFLSKTNDSIREDVIMSESFRDFIWVFEDNYRIRKPLLEFGEFVNKLVETDVLKTNNICKLLLDPFIQKETLSWLYSTKFGDSINIYDSIGKLIQKNEIVCNLRNMSINERKDVLYGNITDLFN